MFSHEDILYENLLSLFGGQEMLELMVRATNFNCIYYNSQGLTFIFYLPGEDTPRLAKFVPMALGSTGQSYYAPTTYQIVVTVERVTGAGFIMEKPYHHVTVDSPDHLVKVFEKVAKVVVSF